MNRDQFAKEFIAEGKKRGKSKEEILKQLDIALKDFDSQNQQVSKAPASVSRGGADTKWGDLPGNILPSAGRMVGDIFSGIVGLVNPDPNKNTAVNIAKVAQGAVQKLDPTQDNVVANTLLDAIPGIQGLSRMIGTNNEQSANAVGTFAKDRYGSGEAVKQTLINDPVGVLSDLSTLVSGAGAGIKAAGTTSKVAKAGDIAGDVSRVSKVARFGDDVARTGAALDPISATMNLVGKGVGSVGNSKIGRTLQAPFAGQFDADAAKLAKEQGIDLPVSAMTKNRPLQGMEALAQHSITEAVSDTVRGKSIGKTIDKAYSRLEELQTEITTKNIRGGDLRETGDIIKTGFQEFQDTFRKQKSALYDAVPEELNTQPAITTNTSRTLSEMIEKKGASLADQTNISLYKKILKKLAPKQPTFSDGVVDLSSLDSPQVTYENLKQTRSEIGAKLKSNDPVVTGDRAFMNQLYAALSDDLDATVKAFSPEAAAQIDRANEFYKTNIEKINSRMGKRIENMNPERLVDELIKPNSETDIALIQEVVGEQAFTELRASFMEKLFKQSMKNEVLDYKKLTTQMDKYGEATLKKLLSPEQHTRLEEVKASLSKIEETKNRLKVGTKTLNGSQTAFTLLNSLKGGSLVGLLFFNPLLATQYILGDVGSQFLFNSKMGKKYLTTGVDVTTPASSAIERAAQNQRGITTGARYSGINNQVQE